MKQKVLNLFVLMTLTSNLLFAQTVININQINSLTTSELQRVKAITFSDRTLKLNFKTGDLISIALPSVTEINFKNVVAGISNQASSVKSTAVIYPNPSSLNDVLRLDYQSDSQSPVTLSIYGLDGTFMGKHVFSKSSSSIFTFSIESLKSGMYIAVIQQETHKTTQKFIVK